MERRRFINLFGKLTAAMRVVPLAALLPVPKPPLNLQDLLKTCYEIKRRREELRCGDIRDCQIQRLSQAQIELLFRGNGPGFETTDGSDPLAPLLRSTL